MPFDIKCSGGYTIVILIFVAILQVGVYQSKYNCSLPHDSRKQCMHICLDANDFRKRLQMTNRLKKLMQNLENSTTEIKRNLSNNDSSIKAKFLEFLNNFVEQILIILELLDNEYVSVDVGTFLDFEKQRQRKRELESIMTQCLDWKKQSAMVSTEMLNELDNHFSKIKLLSIEPQDVLPDIFLWLIIEDKKVAYKRFKPEDLLFSNDFDENGKYCSRFESFFLKTASVKDTEETTPSGGCHVTAYFWLGILKESICCANELPPFFQIQDSCSIQDFILPTLIDYPNVKQFELRCHLFQGRSLIGSDESGLSDPFARILFQGECRQSQTIEQTLCPLWDECLVISNLNIYFDQNYLSNNPPSVIVQVYDFDKLGDNEFLGQTEIFCVLKINTDDLLYTTPALQRYILYKNKAEVGEVLVAAELIEMTEDMIKSYQTSKKPENIKQITNLVQRIPDSIKPTLSDYKLEVLFWGLRDLKTSTVLPVDQPKIQIDWGNGVLESDVIVSYKKFSNFKTPIKSIQIRIPDDPIYQPPFTIRCIDSRAFGRNVLIGTCTLDNIGQYILPINFDEDSCETGSASTHSTFSLLKSTKQTLKNAKNLAGSLPNLAKACFEDNQQTPNIKKSTESLLTFDKKSTGTYSATFTKDENLEHDKVSVKTKSTIILEQENRIFAPDIKIADVTIPLTESSAKKDLQNNILDWWSKYYASIEEFEKQKRKRAPKIYEKVNASSSRANLKQFGKKFLSKADLFQTFHVSDSSKGEIKHDENLLKKLKIATFQIYDKELECIDEFGAFKDCFESFKLYRGKKLSNEKDDCARRVGKFKAYNLRPFDPSGKADPYLNIILGKTKICDKVNKIMSQLNPIFGRSGYNAWRDCLKPTQLLLKLCKFHGLSGPTYLNNSVVVEDKTFFPPADHVTNSPIENSEILALYCLHQLHELPRVGYKLVPEHVETRTLYLPEKPGLEQGKIELWVDIFPRDGYIDIPSAVNITPRKPKSFELRVIIWDTKEVILDDYNALTGTSSVDQYIKGYIISPNTDGQQTDVHYRSLNGDGNFNWRFVFKFDYLDAEEKIVYKTKESLFAIADKEKKVPPKLTLQVWDADVISADDFLGSMVINLIKIPRGAKSAKSCTLDLTTVAKRDKKSYLNLFEGKRTRGWFPFVRQEKNKTAELAGKIDLELILMSTEEADVKPAGLGRDPPDPMPPPQRPETSFAWFSNPLKMLKYDIWIGMRWQCLQIFLVLLLVFFICVFVYTLPEAFANKIIQTSL